MEDRKVYKIGNTEFATEEEYIAAVSDLKKINALMDKYDAKNPEVALKLLSVIYAKPQMFQSAYGEAFIKKLEKCSISKERVKQQVKTKLQAEHTAERRKQKTDALMKKTGIKKKNKTKDKHKPMNQEEQSVCYDILHSSLWIIFELNILLCVVWYIIITVDDAGLWFQNLKQMLIVPVLFLVGVNVFEICFERLKCPFNDFLLVLVSNLMVVLILAGDRMTQSLQLICAVPIVFGPIFQNINFMYLQLLLSAGLLAGHHIYIVRYGRELNPDLLLSLDLSGMLFVLVVFFSVIRQIGKFTQMLNTQTTIDSLTRLHNHEAFYETLDKKLLDYKENPVPLCVLIADIDNFKKVNDTYGHAFGDQVLKVLAEIFSKESSKKCFVARYGGEEFAMVMEMNKADALTRAQSIRKTFEHHRFTLDSGEEKNFTVSIGLAAFEPEFTTSSQFFEKADEALYRAKAGGKNRVCI